MSDLARSQNTGIDYNRLQKLAEQHDLNVSTDYSDLYSNTGTYTSYTGPENARSTINIHKNQTWSWTEPGAELKDAVADMLHYKVGDKLVEYGFPEEIRGIVINYQQMDSLRTYVNEQSNTLCSVIGYLQDGQHVKALPQIPFRTKYQWAKDGAGKSYLDKKKPAPIVGKLGLVGTRGGQPTLCKDCIMNGKATETVVDDKKGGTKIVECEPRGRLYFLVWEVAKIRANQKALKGQSKTKVEVTPITELYDVEGNQYTEPLLLSISMPKSGIQGRWNKDETKVIRGYDFFFGDIIKENRTRNFMQNPIMHYASIRLVMAEGSTVFQTHFTNLGIPKDKQIEYAATYWRDNVPPPTVETLEVPETVTFTDSDNTITTEDSIESLVNSSVDDVLAEDYKFSDNNQSVIPTVIPQVVKPNVEIVTDEEEFTGDVPWNIS